LARCGSSSMRVKSANAASNSDAVFMSLATLHVQSNAGIRW
jgi:hypothetical protein